MDCTARNHKDQTALHVIADGYDWQGNCNSSGEYAPAAMSEQVAKVDAFLNVKRQVRGVPREALLCAIDAEDGDGNRAAWAARLEPARRRYWQAAVATLLVPDALVLPGHGWLGPPLCQRGSATCLSDLPRDLRWRVCVQAGAVISSAEGGVT